MATKKSETGAGLLHEMLRSFVSLAETLNLSRSEREIGVTRQTIRRHIALLEQMRGAPLFDVVDRQYELTESGRSALPEAEELLQRGDAWLEARLGHIDGLQRYSNVQTGMSSYHVQQHGLGKLWSSTDTRLQHCIRQWSEAKGRLASEALAEVLPHSLVFREVQGRWLMTEVGEKSEFARWFGETWARSSIGRPIDALPGGDKFNAVTARTYQDISHTQSLRLDHVVVGFTGGPKEDYNVIAFERLLLGCFYPDDSFGVASVARITSQVSVEGLPDDITELLRTDSKLNSWNNALN